MALAVRAAARAATGICALWGLLALSACEGALGTSPPHAAPANPRAEAGDGEVELNWGAVTDATRYVILWGNDPDARHLRQRDHRHRGHELHPRGAPEPSQVPLQDRRGDERRTRPGKSRRRGDSGSGAGRDRVDCRYRREPGTHHLLPDVAQGDSLPRVFRGDRIAAHDPPSERALRQRGCLAAGARRHRRHDRPLLPRVCNERFTDRRRRTGGRIALAHPERAQPSAAVAWPVRRSES